MSIRNEHISLQTIKKCLTQVSPKTKVFRLNPSISMNKYNSYEQFSSSNEIYDNAFYLLHMLDQHGFLEQEHVHSVVITKGNGTIPILRVKIHEHGTDGYLVDLNQFVNNGHESNSKHNKGTYLLTYFMFISILFYYYTVYYLPLPTKIDNYRDNTSQQYQYPDVNSFIPTFSYDNLTTAFQHLNNFTHYFQM